MGLFLQKVNIIRDFLEDYEDGRCFWPKKVWSKYAQDLGEFTKAENKEKVSRSDESRSPLGVGMPFRTVRQCACPCSRLPEVHVSHQKPLLLQILRHSSGKPSGVSYQQFR